MPEQKDTVQEVNRDKVYSDGTQVRERTVATRSSDDAPMTAQRIVNLIVGIVLGLHAIRFILALLGANTSNAFANFIYTITSPFVAPFRGLFSVNTRVGESSRFEIETIVAALVYALIGWVVIKIIGLSRPAHRETEI